jgi:hypothetical protein
VQEERQHRLGTALPHLLGDQVEVVVVDHDQGAAAASLDLLDHRLGEQLVDGHIAVLPGVVLAPGQLGGEGQPVHAVLEEPQQRVGDHGVEVVVRLLLDLDQAQPHGGGRPFLGGRPVPVEQPRLGLEGDLDGLVAMLGGDGGVLVGGGGAHPDGVGKVGHQPGERRDQPAGTTAGGAARLVAPERNRPAVRQQHHRQVRPGHVRHPGHRRSSPSVLDGHHRSTAPGRADSISGRPGCGPGPRAGLRPGATATR